MMRTRKAVITNKRFSLWLRLLLIVAHQCTTYAAGSLLRASSRGGDTTYESDRHLQMNTRIVDGNVVTDVKKHPYFADWYEQNCGGVLVHDDLVLTAAHCAAEDSITREIYFQTIRRREGGILRRVTDSVVHPDFDANVDPPEYDFLVLKLDSSALVDPSNGDSSSTGVETIQMNTNRAVPATGDRLIVTGYGAVREGGSMSNQLRDVELQAFAPDTCRAHYGGYYNEDLMFCAGSSPAGKDSCDGDSGGPTIDINTNTLVGLVSFGWECGDELTSGIYSRVSYAASWVDGLKCSMSSYPPESCGMPTAPPTSAPPTIAPAVPGKLQTYFRLDSYAEEFAMKIVYEETNSVLASVIYGDLPYPGITYQRGFPDLEPGIYTLRIGDKAKDGNCCEYGGGDSWVVDLNTGNDIWRSDGRYGAYIEVDIEISSRGFASVARETPHYQPGTWPELEQSAMKPENAEEAWPGTMPSQNRSSLAINVQLDDYAMETSFKLRFNVSGGWNDVDAWSNTDGSSAGNGELVSFEYSDLSSGWYHFMINDTANDGLCCDFGRGWVSLMGPISSRNGEKSLAWGNTGEFWSDDEIFFFIDGEGYVSKLSWNSTNLNENR